MAALPTVLSPSVTRSASIVTTEVGSDGVAVLTIDDPAETLNTITPTFARELTRALQSVEEDPTVVAVVLRSGKRDSFIVGANIGLIRSTRFAQDAEDAAREVAACFGRLGVGPKPVVAYLHGPALGGGFELALACAATIASDHPRTVIGLPEVKLGLMPAANGLLRVAERAGLRAALDLGVTGKSLAAADALRLGLVDEVVAEAIGLEAARALALRLAKEPGISRALARRRLRASGQRVARVLYEQNPIGRAALLRRARKEIRQRTRGHSLAAERIVDVIAHFGAKGFRAAADLEPRLFGDLAVSETAHRLIDLFSSRTTLKKHSGLEPNERAAPFPVERVGVLGAGLMGAGITAVSAQAGLSVRMKDTDDAAVGRGLKYVKEALDSRVRLGTMTSIERDKALCCVSGATEYTGFRGADLVFEAVFEDLELKHAVIRDIEARIRDTCVIASNTSSIPISRVAEACSRPEMVVGMHYFSPVERTPLLEVVRTPIADPRAIATAVAIGKRQGKTVIVVRDGAAFYTTRILVPYLGEAVRLLSEGCAVEAIDAAMLDWGFPTGPLELMDEVGIDFVAQVGAIAHAAFGDRMAPPEPLAALRADDRRGKKNARGFYRHGRGVTRQRTVDQTVYAVLGVTPKPNAAGSAEIALRCGLAMVNEALRAYGDGVVRSARDGDVGAVLGVGFPAFRGGPFRYVDVLGAVEVLRRTRSLEQRFGERFEPAPLLVEMARTGKRFYE